MLWLLLLLAAVPVLFVVLVLFLVWPGAPRKRLRQPFFGRSYAHRGLFGAQQCPPENRLPATPRRESRPADRESGVPDRSRRVKDECAGGAVIGTSVRFSVGVVGSRLRMRPALSVGAPRTGWVRSRSGAHPPGTTTGRN